MEKEMRKDREQIYIYITPFNINAVLFYHRLKRDGVLCCGFFDNSPYLFGLEYDGCYIEKMYFRSNSMVFNVSTDPATSNEITQQLINIGYGSEDISYLTNSKISLITDVYDAALDVDLERLLEICPHVAKAPSGIAKIRKLRKLKELGAPTDELTYENFVESKNSHEVYQDDEGKKHILLNNLDLVLTTRCSLRCRYCCNGMQYFKKPQDISAILHGTRHFATLAQSKRT